MTPARAFCRTFLTFFAVACFSLVNLGGISHAFAADKAPVQKGTAVKKNSAKSTTSRPATRKKVAKGKKATVKKKSQRAVPVPDMMMPAAGNDGEDHVGDWWYKLRAWPNDEIDPAAYPRAIQQANALPVYGQRLGGKHSTLEAPISWKLVGPFTIGGRVTKMATHPTDKNTFYAGAAAGGLWKTIDHGESWTCVTDTFASLAIGAVALDPQHPDTVYLGMGEPNGSDSYPGNGVWRSLNGGKSWSSLGLEKTQFISKILVDPTDSRVIYVCSPGPYSSSDTNRGFYKSSDFGATWVKSWARPAKGGTTVPVIDAAINPRNHNEIAFAAWNVNYSTGSYAGIHTGIWLTSDAGSTWQRLDTIAGIGLPNGRTYKYLSRPSLHWANTTPDPTLYAIFTKTDTNSLTKNRTDANFYGLFRSTSPRTHWEKLQDSTMRIPFFGLNFDSVDIFNKQGTYNNSLDGNPNNPNELYISAIDILRSTDGGVTFTDITKNYSEKYFNLDRTSHSDQHGVVFTADPSGTDMLANSDGGVFNTTNFGVNWKQYMNMPITQFWKIRTWNAGMQNISYPLPVDSIKAVGGCQDNGSIARGMTANADWDWINAADGATPALHPTNPNILYTSAQQGRVYLKTSLDSLRPNSRYDQPGTNPLNYDKKWHELFRIARAAGLTDTSEPVTFIPPWVIDETKPNELYTGRLHVYKATVDYADPTKTTWRAWSPLVAGYLAKPEVWGGGEVECLALGVPDQNGRRMIWSGGRMISSKSVYTSALYRTLTRPELHTDSMPTWTIDTAGLPSTTVTSIVADSKDSLLAFAAFSGFSNKVSAPYQHVYRRNPATGKWSDISGDLPNVPVNAMVIDTMAAAGNAELRNNVMYVATDAGVFVTVNGGVNWSTLGTGMPHIAVSDISLYKNLLVAGSHGRSARVADVSGVKAVESPLAVKPRASAANAFSVSPNPVRAGARVTLAGETSSKVTQAELVNEAGAVVWSIDVKPHNGAFSLMMPQVAAGSYMLRLSGNGVAPEERVVVLR